MLSILQTMLSEDEYRELSKLVNHISKVLDKHH
jgi:hypothetical protein